VGVFGLWPQGKKGVAYVIKAIGNNKEQKKITAWRHNILMWKTLSNKER
jgi:hypothetical protein